MGVDLSAIDAAASVAVAAGSVTTATADLARAEADSYAHEASPHDEQELIDKKIRIQIHKREMDQIDDLLTARKEYARKIFWLVIGWLGGLAVFLLLEGFHLGGYQLSEKVLLALVGGTTISVLGIFVIVANFLFPKGQVDLLNGLRKKSRLTRSNIKPSTPSAPRQKRGSKRAHDESGVQAD